MFQFPGLAPFRVIHLQCTRLSHSEICGLTVVCTYPQLIAAYHVLHRLSTPRHPPCALICFKNFSSLINYVLFVCINTLFTKKLLSQYVKDL